MWRNFKFIIYSDIDCYISGCCVQRTVLCFEIESVAQWTYGNMKQNLAIYVVELFAVAAAAFGSKWTFSKRWFIAGSLRNSSNISISNVQSKYDEWHNISYYLPSQTAWAWAEHAHYKHIELKILHQHRNKWNNIEVGLLCSHFHRVVINPKMLWFFFYQNI